MFSAILFQLNPAACTLGGISAIKRRILELIPVLAKLYNIDFAASCVSDYCKDSYVVSDFKNSGEASNPSSPHLLVF